MSTVVPALAAALVERWAALPIVETERVGVVHGAPVDGLSVEAMILVEFDGDPDQTTNSEFTHEWLDMACTRKRETGLIRCTAFAQTGSAGGTAVAGMAELAGRLVSACDDDLTSDITAGGIVWSAYVQQGSAQQVKNDRGVAVIVPFVVAYAAPA